MVHGLLEYRYASRIDRLRMAGFERGLGVWLGHLPEVEVRELELALVVASCAISQFPRGTLRNDREHASFCLEEILLHYRFPSR